jgi:hypothetical protein
MRPGCTQSTSTRVTFADRLIPHRSFAKRSKSEDNMYDAASPSTTQAQRWSRSSPRIPVISSPLPARGVVKTASLSTLSVVPAVARIKSARLCTLTTVAPFIQIIASTLVKDQDPEPTSRDSVVYSSQALAILSPSISYSTTSNSNRSVDCNEDNFTKISSSETVSAYSFPPNPASPDHEYESTWSSSASHDNSFLPTMSTPPSTASTPSLWPLPSPAIPYLPLPLPMRTPGTPSASLSPPSPTTLIRHPHSTWSHLSSCQGSFTQELRFLRHDSFWHTGLHRLPFTSVYSLHLRHQARTSTPLFLVCVGTSCL